MRASWNARGNGAGAELAPCGAVAGWR